MDTLSNKIILLHGAIGAEDQLQPLKALLEENYEVYSMNFSGHGTAAFKNSFGIPQFADELKEFIEANKLQGANVFGYSMGGYVALYLALQHKELLGNIITLGTKFDWNKESAEKESKMLDPEAILQKVPKFAEALQLRHGEENWKVLLQKTALMMQDLAKTNLLSADNLKNIGNKVLIGLADKDTMVTYKETREVYESITGAAMFMLPQSKHPIEQLNVRLLATIIDNFINS